MAASVAPAVKVLAGDIGGTKTLLQLVAFDPTAASARGSVLYERRYASQAYRSLSQIVGEFMAGAPAADGIYSACLGVAGPVFGDAEHQHSRLTNLPWEPDSHELAALLGIRRVRLINDFQAVGYGIEALEGPDLVTLNTAQPRPGAPRLVLGAGTGLGVGLLFRHGNHYECYPTEGGHLHFAPRDAEQEALLAYLRGDFDRVSWERLVSGPGLVNIYRFLLARAGRPAAEDPLFDAEDPAAAIAAYAAGQPLARRAMELFVTLYGSVAGDLALVCLAYGGVYIAGGIAPKVLDWLQSGRFVEAFTDKGRMQPVTAQMPVQVVVNANVGILGTALAASRL
jgi:glucokinase